MAMAMFVYGIVQAFNDMGISNAIIQRKEGWKALVRRTWNPAPP
jgi:O-antigen/teichoic acid export membrane protein